MTRSVPLILLFICTIFGIGLNGYGQTVVWEWNPPGGPGTGSSSWSDLNANWTQKSVPLIVGASLPGSRLEWAGLGEPVGTNNLIGIHYQRLSFFGLQSYSISGNQITLSDASLGSNGMVISQSPVEQSILFPILFNDLNKDGIINTQSTGPLVFSSISLGNNLTALRIFGENADGVITLRDALSGSRPVVIGNAGGSNDKPNTRVVFSGNNSPFTGPITLTGILSVQNSSALGTSTLDSLVVNNGSSLEVSGGISISGRNIAINGAGVGLTGAIRNVLGNNTILSNILLINNSRISNDDATNSFTLNKIIRRGSISDITFNGVGNIILNDMVGSATDSLNGELIKRGTGTLTIRQPCYYNGVRTSILGGAVVLGASNLLPVKDLLLNAGTFRASSATNATGYSQSFKRLTLSSNNSTIALGTGDHSLIFEASGATTWTANRKITITGWKGIPGESGTPGFGKIFFGNDATGLTDAQLAQITFAGYCDGAMLRNDGELVPAIKPFIQNVTSSVTPTGVTGFIGFVGATISIKGCLFQGATQVNIGTTELKLLPTPQFTYVDSTLITFVLGDTVEGEITIITPDGERKNPTPLTNLGYITRAAGNWTAASTWLGMAVPPNDRPVSINHGNVVVDGIQKIINSTDPPTNPLTIYAGSARLSQSNRFPLNTPLILSGGEFRLYNATTTPPAVPVDGTNGYGFSQTFSTLTLRGNANISFGNTATVGSYHEIRFDASDLIPWTSGATLTIYNWDDVRDSANRKTRIIVSGSGLTQDQLRQIKFGNKCQGAKLLGSGELVPAEAPFVANVVSSPASGSVLQAFYGAKITLSGCKFDFVDTVKVGGVSVPFTLVGNPVNSIEFTYTEGLPSDSRITLTTNESPIKDGISGTTISPAGYATGSDGNWYESATWLSGIFPSSASKVTVRNKLNVNTTVLSIIDSMVINSGATLDLQNTGLLTISKLLINSGTVSATGSGRINLVDGGIITNNSTFNMNNGTGTVNFLGSGVIGGTQRITFHNLWINSGNLIIPNTNGSNLPASMVPTILGEFRINGGGIIAANGLPNSTFGPRFGPSSSLVYASQTTQRRTRIWYSATTSTLGNPGVPNNVIVEGGTSLIMDGPTPNVNSSFNVVCFGDFIVRKGSVRVDMVRPLEIFGSLQIGENDSSNAVVNMGRLASEVDALSPTTFVDGTHNYIKVHKNFIVYPNSNFDARQNTKQFHFTDTGTSYFEVPGADPLSSSPALTLNYVHNEKNGIVILKSSLGIANDIQLSTNAYIKTDPNVFLRIAAAGKISGSGANSFIAGRLEKVTASSPAPNASADFTFPLGKIDGSTYTYRPVIISNLKHSGTTIYSAEYKDSSTTEFPRSASFLDAYLQGIWANEFWEVNKVSGTGKARVGIPYVPGRTFTTSPPGSSNVGVVRWTGDSWEFTKEEDNFNDTTNTYPEFLPVAASKTVYSDTILNFSPFTIGWGDQNILSIKLLYFTGGLSGNDVVLKWKIEETEELKHFIVEHSIDGRNFAALGKVESQENKEYGYRHGSPGSGVHYYRLQMVEKSGEKSFSRVEAVQLGVNRTLISGLVQNPVAGSVAILDIYSAKSQQAEATVYDMSGRLVFRQTFSLGQGKNKARLSLLPLAAGQYNMRILTSDGVEKLIPLLK